MDVVPCSPADPQPAEPVEVGEGPLDNPAVGAEAGSVWDAASGDDGFHAQGPGQAPVLVVVVAAIPEHRVGPPARPAALAEDRRDGLKQGDERGDVVAVAASQGGGKRNAGGIGDQVALAAISAPVNGASPCFGAPFNARMWEPSTTAREKSRASAPRSRARRSRAAAARRRPRSTRQGVASRSCPIRTPVPAGGAPTRSRCAERTGCPGTPACPDVASDQDDESVAPPAAGAVRLPPTTRHLLPTASAEPHCTPRSTSSGSSNQPEDHFVRGC